LHPELRLSWFKTHWEAHPKWYKKAETSLRSTFSTYLVDANAADSARDDDNDSIEAPSRREVPGSYATDERRRRTMWVNKDLLTGKKSHKEHKRASQLDEYIDGADLDELTPEETKLMADPHRWWAQIGRKRFPIVYKMAMDILCVPATSCDCERCFSSARRTITCDRNSLSPTVVEALQLQKNWLRRGVVTSHLKKLEAHIVKRDERLPAPAPADDADLHEFPT
ncbi:transposase-like protein, partial [Paraphaeosphaeria sporulosa]